MKTFVPFLLAFVLFTTTSLNAQDKKTVFANASLAKAGDGMPCMQLDWKQGAEQVSYYIIERSTDGKTFKQIALVFCSEDPSFADYKFRDKGFGGAGTELYYRIALVNEQKELTYLPVKKVDSSLGGLQQNNQPLTASR